MKAIQQILDAEDMAWVVLTWDWEGNGKWSAILQHLSPKPLDIRVATGESLEEALRNLEASLRQSMTIAAASAFWEMFHEEQEENKSSKRE